MELSVIIVNYNVKHLLEQCLYSVAWAADGIQTEVFVVDNCSSDDSVAYLTPRFPGVHFIENKVNAGFGKANNQALAMASGKYVLFLNPDTIVPEDCFFKCFAFMEAQEKAGATGVKMINGQGKFLKESKRGFPSPSISLFKMTGLTALFPRSKFFAGYYLGHLDENRDHEAPVLSGAFMWVRKAVLDITGGFDEQFFMYAEDIDLSYRIIQSGFRNFYFSGTTILHYKGESAPKNAAYVKQFYKAMSQFVRKYFSKTSWGIYPLLLNTAIWLRSGIEYLKTHVKNAFPKVNSASEKIFLIGDESSMMEMKSMIEKDPRKILVDALQEADKILLCEGLDHSVVEHIRYMEMHPGKWYAFHMKGADS